MLPSPPSSLTVPPPFSEKSYLPTVLWAVLPEFLLTSSLTRLRQRPGPIPHVCVRMCARACVCVRACVCARAHV
eukprot:6213220-Pleurochrysis_carterae.AAC.2